MKTTFILICCVCCFGMSAAQIIIDSEELPTALGTTWTTLNDSTGEVIVNVGAAGENQRWEFFETVEGTPIEQTVVAVDSTPFSADFSQANYVIHYHGSLLDIIYSDVFPEITGDVYFYQQISDTAVCLLGSGFCSDFVSGSAKFEPANIILNLLPNQYGNTWISQSQYSISKDTTILGISGEFRLMVFDSAYSVIDGWGTVAIPLGEFECLRMKSYVTMDEQVTFNDMTLISKRSRVINYNWLAENYGLLMRVASHNGELDDNFTKARFYSRMSSYSTPTTVHTANKSEFPETVRLIQNYPNPFNNHTIISYSFFSNKSEFVKLTIYNLLGEEVRILINENQSGGSYEIIWDGQDNSGKEVSSGIYYAELKTGGIRQMKKMALVR